MSSSEFVSDSLKFLEGKLSEYEEYADNLKATTSNMSGVADFIKAALTARASADPNSGYTEDSVVALEKIIDSLVDNAFEIQQGDGDLESFGDISLALLGGVLSSDTEAIFSFISVAADGVVDSLDTRKAHIEEMSSILSELDGLLALISPEWYDTKFTGRLESSVAVLGDASKTLSQMTELAAKERLDRSKVEKVSLDIDGAILYMNDDENLQTIVDIGNLLDKLQELNDDLVPLDIDCIEGISGLSTSIDSFVGAESETPVIFSHYKRMLALAVGSIDSVTSEINQALSKGLDQTIAENVHRWIDELVSAKESLNSSIVDYTESITDETNQSTINLTEMINTINALDNPITLTIPDDVDEIVNQIKTKLSSNTDVDKIRNNISSVTGQISTDSTNTDSMTFAIYSSDLGEKMATVTNYMNMILGFSQDKLIEWVLHSNWSAIMNAKNIYTSYIGGLGVTLSNMKSIYEDGFAYQKALNIYYQMQGYYGIEIGSIMNYNSLSGLALKRVVDVKIPEIKGLIAATKNLTAEFAKEDEEREDSDA